MFQYEKNGWHRPSSFRVQRFKVRNKEQACGSNHNQTLTSLAIRIPPLLAVVAAPSSSVVRVGPALESASSCCCATASGARKSRPIACSPMMQQQGQSTLINEALQNKPCCTHISFLHGHGTCHLCMKKEPPHVLAPSFRDSSSGAQLLGVCLHASAERQRTRSTALHHCANHVGQMRGEEAKGNSKLATCFTRHCRRIYLRFRINVGSPRSGGVRQLFPQPFDGGLCIAKNAQRRQRLSREGMSLAHRDGLIAQHGHTACLLGFERLRGNMSHLYSVLSRLLVGWQSCDPNARQTHRALLAKHPSW